MAAPKKPFLDSLLEGIGEAITDIRHKLVEEPMYGRVVTEESHKGGDMIAHTNNVKQTHIDNSRNSYHTNVAGSGNIYAHSRPATFEEYRKAHDAPQQDKGQEKSKDRGIEPGD